MARLSHILLSGRAETQLPALVLTFTRIYQSEIYLLHMQKRWNVLFSLFLFCFLNEVT